MRIPVRLLVWIGLCIGNGLLLMAIVLTIGEHPSPGTSLVIAFVSIANLWVCVVRIRRIPSAKKDLPSEVPHE